MIQHTCTTCSGLRITGPPPVLCSTCNGSGSFLPGTVADGRAELWKELLMWQSYTVLSAVQASRLAEVATVLVDQGCRYPGDGRLVTLTGVRAYMDAGLVDSAREFYDKHNELLSSSDRLTLRLEFRRIASAPIPMKPATEARRGQRQ